MRRTAKILPALILIGCAQAAMTTNVTVGFSRPGIEFGHLALLPVSGDERSVEHRQHVAGLAERELMSQYPGFEFVRPATSREIIEGEGLVSTYASLLDMHERTGVLDREKVMALGRALGSDYLLQLHCSYDSRVVREHDLIVSGIASETQELQEFRVYAYVWSTEDGTRVWEGTGAVESETGEFTVSRDVEDMLLMATRHVVGRLPIRRTPAG